MKEHCEKCGGKMKTVSGGIVIHVGNGTQACDKGVSLDEIFPSAAKKPVVDILPPARVVTPPDEWSNCPHCKARRDKHNERTKRYRAKLRAEQ